MNASFVGFLAVMHTQAFSYASINARRHAAFTPTMRTSLAGLAKKAPSPTPAALAEAITKARDAYYNKTVWLLLV